MDRCGLRTLLATVRPYPVTRGEAVPFDLRQLRYALATAKVGSYHHAARTCGVDEELLIEEIAALEGVLRVKLFEPVGRAMLPTPHGMRFLRDAEHLIWRAEQIASLLAMTPGQDGSHGGLFDRFEKEEAPCSCSDHIISVGLTGITDRRRGQDDARSEIDSMGEPANNTGEYVDLCRSILTARKLIGRTFGTDLFADPAGEMLLDLYVREYDGLFTSITGIWNASNAAYGTARRSLAIMERRGLITRMPDAHDGRRTLVRLTDPAQKQIEACLDIILGRPRAKG